MLWEGDHMKTNWKSYGLNTSTHDEADRLLVAIMGISSNPAVITSAAKEAIWRLEELSRRSPEYRKKFE
jgi:hypothetical protein